jgi:hypothetical protein
MNLATKSSRSAKSSSRSPSSAKSSSILLPSFEDFRRSVIYRRDPVIWAQERLGIFLWSKQKEILYSIRDNRRTAVPSCYDIGKSFVSAVAVSWWLDVHPVGSARVVTTAPTGYQVKAILWSEIADLFARGKLKGRLNQTEWWMEIDEEGDGDGKYTREKLVAFGRKPAEYTPSAFQGIHAKYVLVIKDEAAGIGPGLQNAIKGLLSNEYARELDIGNPEDCTAPFYRHCLPDSGFNVIPVSAFDTPNFTGEEIPETLRDLLISPTWVEERKKDWGENSPMYQAKVLARFPEDAENTLIPLSWIRAAQDRWREKTNINDDITGDIDIGVDVGGGGDSNCICVKRGRRAIVEYEDKERDTMKTLGRVLKWIKQNPRTRAAKVDYIGIGHGAVDRAGEMHKDQVIRRTNPDLAKRAGLIQGASVGRAAIDNTQYTALRSEGYWTLREMFREGIIDIDDTDEKLAAQLSAIKYYPSSGRIQVETKEDLKSRGLPSPDRADSLMLACLKLPGPIMKRTGLTFGRKHKLGNLKRRGDKIGALDRNR